MVLRTGIGAAGRFTVAGVRGGGGCVGALGVASGGRRGRDLRQQGMTRVVGMVALGRLGIRKRSGRITEGSRMVVTRVIPFLRTIVFRTGPRGGNRLGEGGSGDVGLSVVAG